jgi:hypothetical protein
MNYLFGKPKAAAPAPPSAPPLDLAATQKDSEERVKVKEAELAALDGQLTALRAQFQSCPNPMRKSQIKQQAMMLSQKRQRVFETMMQALRMQQGLETGERALSRVRLRGARARSRART